MHETLRLNDAFFADTLAASWGPLAPGAEAPYLAALAEVQVAEELRLLPRGWRVLHSVPTRSGGHLGQVVIGPAGVFVISTTSAPGARVRSRGTEVLLGRRPLQAAHAAERDARAVRRALPGIGSGDLPVVPVVAIVGAQSVKSRGTTWGAVVAAPRLVAWLTSLPVLFTDYQVAALTSEAALPSTWEVEATAETDPSADFWVLHADVNGAVAVPDRRR